MVQIYRASLVYMTIHEAIFLLQNNNEVSQHEDGGD